MRSSTPALTVQEFYDTTFKTSKCATLSATTIAQYDVSIKRLSAFLARPALLTDLTPNTLSAWQQTAIEYGLAPKTVRLRRHYLQAIAKLAIESGELPADFEVATKRRGALPKEERKPQLPADIGPGMFLADFVGVYVTQRNKERPIGKDLGVRSRQNLDDVAAGFSKAIGRPARVIDLTADRINSHLAKLTVDGKSPYTVKSRRTGLMMLLRRAIRMRLINNVDPHDVRSVFCPRLNNDGYDVEQMRRLVAVASQLKGVNPRTKIPRKIYWPAALRVLWDLGLRSGDILRLKVEHFKATGVIWAREQKTGKHRWRPLHPSTTAMLVECIAVDPDRERIFPGLSSRAFWRAFREVARAANLGGTSKYIRRGAASEVDREHPGMGARFLNHSDPQIFEEHYRVGRIAIDSKLMPPELGACQEGAA